MKSRKFQRFLKLNLSWRLIKKGIKRLTKINKFLDAHTALYYSRAVKYMAAACYKIADKHG
ncbi:hypothetical protein AKG09_02785 [Neisseria sp. 83E34]|nr:hypothetical protein AKG09_02785 [Neisseria sp. 83E34]